MLKSFFLFLIFALIGFGIFIFYTKFRNSSSMKITDTPRPSFSLQIPPKNSKKGEITSLSGSVSYQGRGFDYATSISKPQSIVQGDEISTLGDGKADISFEEIGEIQMQPQTHLNIVQTLPENFVIQQTQGEAVYLRSGAIPFSVKSLDLGIDLDSETKISLQVDSESSVISFTIISGKVKFYYTDTDNNTNVIPAKSGKELIFNDNTKTFRVKLL